MSRSKRLLLAGAILLTLLVVTHSFWLTGLAAFLVKTDPLPARADAIVVLAGDGTGERIRKAAELAKDGVAPVVLVSGPDEIYGTRESVLAIDYIARAGFDRNQFVACNFNAESTREEARFLVDALRRRKAQSAVVVTSDYHTRRSRVIFHQLLPDFQLYVVAAPSPPFTTNTWWYTRVGRKMFLYEWMKTVAEVVGL